MSPQTSPQTIAAVAGTIEKPREAVSGALDLYFSETAADQLRLKSEEQRRRWKNKRRQSVNTFISLVGDKPMHEFTRDDARERVKNRSITRKHGASPSGCRTVNFESLEIE